MVAGRTATILRVGGFPRRGRVLALAALAAGALVSVTPAPASAACTQYVPKDIRFLKGGTVRFRPSNRASVVTGRVTCEDGTPAPQGAVGMGEDIHVRSTGQFLRYHTQNVQLVPNNQGVFVFKVPEGPSRVLLFVYGPPTGGLTLAPQRLLLNSRARPKLKSRPGRRRVGQKTAFYGSIPDTFLSGRPSVALQARTGRKWRTFKVVAVNPRGKYRGRYRFTGTTSPRRYRFRAKIVDGGTDYPYLTRPSRTSRVFVRP